MAGREGCVGAIEAGVVWLEGRDVWGLWRVV